MRHRHGTGGVALGERPRWISLLLAVALLAAITFAIAPPAAATGPTTDPGEIALNERFIEWYDEEDAVHLFVFGDDMTFDVTPGETVVVGFEFVGATEQELRDLLDSGGADITLSINGGPAVSVNSGYQDPFTAVPGVGPNWSWDHDNDGIGDGNGNLVDDWDGPVLFFRYESMPIVEPTTLTFSLGALSNTITVDAVCNGGDTCDFEDPASNWQASITCEDDCTVVVHDPGDSTADIEVSNDTEIELTVIVDKGVGTSPGLASVDKVDPDSGAFIETLPKCTGNRSSDCVTIIRIKGARTQYTVKIGTDPRFKFR